jgi:hypothetical protein
MYDTAGRNANVHQTSKARRFHQLAQKDKALIDIPTDLLPNRYNPAGQENADQLKSIKTHEQAALAQKTSHRPKVPVLGNADNNGLNKLNATKLPDMEKRTTSESKYIVPENIYDKRSGETFKKLRYLGEVRINY